jgi:hypothetical protein
LKSLPQAQSYLKASITLQQLDDIAHEMSDNEFAERFAMLGSELENEDREGLSS